jgi:adenosine kinase
MPRSLVTTLRAAEKFDQSHLSSPSVAPLIEGAKVFYVEGYFLTHGLDPALELSKIATNAGKVTPSDPTTASRLLLISTN